ncbi:hypothetical protein ACOSP7_003865 [Xanthoceras sorbifolium]
MQEAYGETTIRGGWEVSHSIEELVLCLKLNYGEYIKVYKMFGRQVTAIKLLHQDNIDNHPLLNLILSCKDFIRREWDCVITHGFRESNRVADGLAFLGKNMVAGIIYYEAPPPQIARLFLDDLCGIPTMRTVSL